MSISKLKEIVQNENDIVFFGGAGVSTESGIPDFRSRDGLYNQKYKYDPEYLLSIEAFEKVPEAFWQFYREKILIDGVCPNKGHHALARLEAAGKLNAVVTQNIDSLHEIAGSKTVYHLHGSVLTNHCLNCGVGYSVESIQHTGLIPKCKCGGSIKPDIVLYGEKLPQIEWNKSMQAIIKAKMLIVAGTSLSVYPAASLIEYFNGCLVIINREATKKDETADLLIRENIGEVLDFVTKGIS